MFTNRRGAYAAVILCILTFAIALVAVPRADAHQPYGGCDEAWQAPRSQGAAHCRSHGWLVRPRIVVGPHGWVRFNRMPACVNEDGSYRRANGTVGLQRHCFWDADTRGNRRGRDSIIDRVHGRLAITWVKG